MPRLIVPPPGAVPEADEVERSGEVERVPVPETRDHVRTERYESIGASAETLDPGAAIEGAPTRVAILAVPALARRSDQPPAPEPSESSPRDSVGRRTEPRDGTTQRYGTLPGPAIEPEPEPRSPIADDGPAGLRAVQRPPVEPSAEDPSRERGEFRAVEPATSTKPTEFDLSAVPSTSSTGAPLRDRVPEPSGIESERSVAPPEATARPRRRIEEATLVTPRVAPRRLPRALIIAVALVLALGVIALAMAVRGP